LTDALVANQTVEICIFGEKNLAQSSLARLFDDPVVRASLPIMENPSTGNSRTAI
jgi:hypothetical protein